MPSVYKSGRTRAFKWNVGKLSSKVCVHHPYQACRCPYQPTAGVILVQHAAFPGGVQTIAAVSNPTQHLEFFKNSETTKVMLSHVLKQLPILRSCKNIDECAEDLAQDFSSQFDFKSGFSDHLVFLLSLEVHEIEENRGEKIEWTLKNGEEIERFLTTRCPLFRAVEPEGLEEIKGNVDIFTIFMSLFVMMVFFVIFTSDIVRQFL